MFMNTPAQSSRDELHYLKKKRVWGSQFVLGVMQ